MYEARALDFLFLVATLGSRPTPLHVIYLTTSFLIGWNDEFL